MQALRQVRAFRRTQSPPEVQLDPVALYRAFGAVSDRTKEEVLSEFLGGTVAMLVKYMGAKKAKHTLVELLLANEFWSGLEILQPEIERICLKHHREPHQTPLAPIAPTTPTRRSHKRKKI